MLDMFMSNAYSLASLWSRSIIPGGIFVDTANELFLLENSL